MKKGCLIFGFFVLLSGCSGLQVSQTVPEAIQGYGAECVRSGYQEGTEPYADCISQSWKMAEEKERARQQRKEMLLLIRGRGLPNAGNI